MNITIPTLAIIIPCLNEEEIIKDSTEKLLRVLDNLKNNNKISKNSYICFIDDGSQDNSWHIINELGEKYSNIKAIQFFCNFGHQKALMCGLTENDADIYITIDCDLQDDINIIPNMIDKYLSKDIEVVYGVRSDRKTDNFLKRLTAQAYYKLLFCLGVKTIFDSADFRLMSKKVVDTLKNYKENSIYLRGLIYNLGFKYDIVKYKRLERKNGQAKFNLYKSIELASDGITSLTIMPVRILFLLGLTIFLIGIFKQSSIFFLGGLNLLGLGIIGEYIAKINIEVRNRPNWIIKEKKNF